MHLSSLLLAGIAALGTLSAQGITLVEGPSLASLDVRVLDELNVTAPGSVILQGIELLPIEITGRVANQELQTWRSRRVERHGFVRVELPGGSRLFRYRRLGGQFWGFLHVPANGVAEAILELPGRGANGTSDPFDDRIGVANDGRHAVAMLRTGGLYVLRLDGGRFGSTGTAARFVSTGVIARISMMVGRTHVFFHTTDDRIWRLALVDGALPVDRTPTRSPNDILRNEMAMSGDGSSVVYLDGPRDQWRFVLLGETGNARVLPPPPSKYEDPGYLPEGSGQPQMHLNGDGSRLVYLDSIVSDEIYMLDTTGSLPRMHITDDNVFQPTIGVHIFPSFINTTLIVAIGNHLQMDWFKVDMGANGGTAVNLTGTGSMTMPFPVGRLAPTQSGVVGNFVLVTDGTGPTQTLRQLDPATGQSQVLFQDLTATPEAGGAFHQTPDLIVHGVGDRLYRGATGALFAATPPEILLSTPTCMPDFGATFVHLTSGWGIVVSYLNDGGLLAGPLEFGVQQIVVTQRLGTLIHGPTTRYYYSGSATLPLAPAAVRVFLSGAGG